MNGNANLEVWSLGLTAVVLALQVWNVYITNRIKLWAMERFVTKSDFLETLHFWSNGNGKSKGHP